MTARERVIREKRELLTRSRVIVVREAFGQVVDYDCYREDKNGKRTYLGGGTKREALTAFRKNGGEVAI